MQGFLAGGVCFAEKATNSRSLLSVFSFHNSSSINHSRWASISNHPCWKIINHPSIFIIINFHLLLYVAEVLSSLINHEWRPIRIEFLTLQGKPNTHVWGMKSPTQQLPSLSRPWIRVTPSTTEYGYTTPACCAHDNDVQCSKRVKVKSTRRSSQVLKLTDYHISRHVVSMFKCLTKLPHTAALRP